MIKQHERNKEDNKKYLEKNDPARLASLPEYFPFKFDQVKEKYGGLRLYFSGGDEYAEGLVSMAEAMSYKICEVCGNAGKPNKGGWISTLCDSCRNKSYGSNT
jgi:NADH pyrophosphatase NudC (nudix superfamily)